MTIAASAIWFVCSGVAAEAVSEAKRIDEEVTVVGSRIKSSRSILPEATIDEVTLSTIAPVSILDGLRTLPGIYASQPGGRSGVPSVSIRGAESNFALVLVDGVRVNDPMNTRGGSFDFATVDIDEVESIQLIRGPASAIYGSDAMAGVLNLSTESRQRTGTELVVGAGESGLSRYAVRSSLEPGENVRVNGVASKASEDYSGDGSFDGTFGRASIELSSNQQELRLAVSAADTEQRAFPEESGGDRFAVLRTLDQRDTKSLTLSGQYRVDLSDATFAAVSLSWLDREEDFVSPGIAPGPVNAFGVPANSAVSELQRTEFSSYVSQNTGTVQWAAGGDWRREEGSADGEVMFLGPTVFDIERDVLGAFAEARWQALPRLQVEGSVRLDFPESESTETTYGLASRWQFSDRLFGIARLGTGFKLPSFFALGNPLVGNPDLKPETVRSWETGLELELANFSARAIYFNNAYEDLVDFDPQLFTNVNRSAVDTSGVDLSIQGTALNDRLSFRALASYVDIDVQDAAPLRQRPDWRYGADLAFSVDDRLTITGSVHYTDERFDTSIPTPTIILDGYTRTDLLAHYDVTEALRVSVGALNLLDEQYEDAYGVDAQGRQLRVRARWRL